MPPYVTADPHRHCVAHQGGGTGFAAHDGDRVMASHHWALGPGSGKQDLRGQHQGVRSAGGLAFMN